MLLRRYQQLVSKIAILLVLFASLAPSVSHAMAAQNSTVGLVQEICSVDGVKKIVIQTVTSKGQQITAVFDAKDANPNHHTGLAHHLEHCPFCGSAAANIGQTPPTAAWVFMLAQQTTSVFYDDVLPTQSAYLQTAQLSRAPPTL